MPWPCCRTQTRTDARSSVSCAPTSAATTSTCADVGAQETLERASVLVCVLQHGQGIQDVARHRARPDGARQGCVDLRLDRRQARDGKAGQQARLVGVELRGGQGAASGDMLAQRARYHRRAARWTSTVDRRNDALRSAFVYMRVEDRQVFAAFQELAPHGP